MLVPAADADVLPHPTMLYAAAESVVAGKSACRPGTPAVPAAAKVEKIETKISRRSPPRTPLCHQICYKTSSVLGPAVVRGGRYVYMCIRRTRS